jgi:3-hydroxyacyl-[acyl-carrier-protein] dehydratase
MKLLDELFKIAGESRTNDNFSFSITLDPTHSIYAGHFPGYPITPAVIQIQILQDLIELNLQKRIQLSSIKSSKFLKVINPLENSAVTVKYTLSIEDNLAITSAQLEVSEEVYSKFSVIFKLK